MAALQQPRLLFIFALKSTIKRNSKMEWEIFAIHGLYWSVTDADPSNTAFRYLIILLNWLQSLNRGQHLGVTSPLIVLSGFFFFLGIYIIYILFFFFSPPFSLFTEDVWSWTAGMERERTKSPLLLMARPCAQMCFSRWRATPKTSKAS